MKLDWPRAAEQAAALMSSWDEREPGGAILGFDRIGPRFEETCGLASLEHGLPFTPATPSRLASITKHVFCAMALREGLDMATPLGQLVEGLAPALAAVPAGRALNMTGGLPDLVESFGLLGIPSTATHDRAMLLRMARTLPGLNFAPGRSIAYSNTGYRLVEAGLAAPFGQLLERHCPGFDFHYPEDETEPVPGLAAGYWRGADGGWRRGRYGLNFSASGGLACSAEGLMRWSQQLMADDGACAGLWAQLARSGTLENGQETGYGLGLSRVALPGPELWGHGGSLPGYKNHVLMAPELGVGVVVLSNREEAGAYPMALAVMLALTAQARPGYGHLPPGLYAEPDGPFWVESLGGAVVLLGAQEPIWRMPDGAMGGLQAHLPFRLRAVAGGGLRGQIGHRECHLVPVPEDAALDCRLTGRWVSPGLLDEAVLQVSDGADGPTIRLPGPGARSAPLRPLGEGKALAERISPPGRSRFALWLAAPDELLLVSQRSRVFRFHRA